MIAAVMQHIERKRPRIGIYRLSASTATLAPAVEHRRNVPVKADKELANALRQMIWDRGLCERMDREGMRLAERPFAQVVAVRQALDIYRDALAR